MKLTRPLAAVGFLLAVPGAAAGQTEFQLQMGSLVNPFEETSDGTVVVTFQSAAQWSWGDHFLFFDYSADGGNDGFNEKDLYGEWYPSLSLGKITGGRVGFGPIRDFAVLGGVNYSAQAKVLKYTPGFRASWDIPGFIFLNTEFARMIDASSGLDGGGAPSTSDGFMFDVNWLATWEMLGHSFTFTGHAEYISGVTNELGNNDLGWILAQPQLRLDVGRALGGGGGRLMTGIEYQYWRNKLGTDVTESAVQFLVVWRL
ncbi:nucleoside-binding protein [Candidatus Palauibacter sp.]|uniref:nucleoside-binding protein n=1 Tax=Candidatus Palauibacter sp. TaxID=3101350 RepID=UPI003C6F1967